MGGNSITATSVVLTGSTDIACNFDLTGAAVGIWDVYVANPDGQNATISGGFTVNHAAPTVTAITPTNANTGNASVSVTNLAGANFYGTPTVLLKKTGQTPITATSVNVASSTKITCNFDLTGAAVGSWDVYVANPDGQNVTLPGSFTVNHATPTVNSITPNSGINNGAVGITDLKGTNFYGTPTVQLKMTGKTSVTATSVVLTGSTDIACSFDLTGAAAGIWDVYVANPDGQNVTLSGGFAVNNPIPTVGSIIPNSGVRDATVGITDLKGANFYGTPTVQLKSGGNSITATSVVLTGSTDIACNFDLTGAAAGSWDVYVKNQDGQNATLAGGFTVLNPIPGALTSINPTSATAGSTVAVTVTGTGSYYAPTSSRPVERGAACHHLR